MKTRRIGRCFALVLVLCASGCGSSKLDLVDVKGVVTLDGKPLSAARVVFSPAARGRPSIGMTDVNGHYRLLYVEGRMGALSGKHTVSISTFVEADPDSSDPLIQTGQRELVPEKYNTQTTLEDELNGSSAKLDFDLKSS